jgi:shikimate dehydrogenase
LNLLNKNTFVIDLIYNPEKTLLLQEAEKKGCKILNGIEMLLLQAEKSWEIWQNSIK